MKTPTERLRLRAFGPGLELWLRHFVGISFVFLVAQLPLVIAFAVDPTRPPGLGSQPTFTALIFDLLISASPNALAFLTSTALEALGTAVVLLLVLQTLEGQPASLATSARRGLARFGAVLVTSLFVAAMIVLGLASYLVPGLFALGFFWLAVPACVVERVSPFRALGRSGELASGSVLVVIGLALVTFVVPRVLEFLLGRVLRADPALAFGLVLATRVVFGGLAAVSVAVAYRELRRIKDDADGLALIRAFE